MTSRWGLVGHGFISGTFRDALAVVDGAQLVAVTGRDESRVEAFASEHDIGAVFTSVDAMLAEGDLDAVYICTPHPAHAEAALACVGAGVPVLVEKPLTPTADQTGAVIDAARGHGTFAMEAMWTRFLPIYDVVRRWIEDGRIGEVLLVTASFGFRAPVDSESRLFSPDAAGGSLLDVGVYPLTLAHWVYGASPTDFHVTGRVGDSGVDEHVAMAAKYPGGGLAQLDCAITANLDFQAVIRGTDGHISIPAFWAAQSATLHAGGEETTETAPHRANGFEYEIEEVLRCVDAGLTESPTMPLAISLELAQTCDAARDQLGVRYPFES